ncbi:MAG TPA: glycosyltransferase N-terminal domain-containing protein [bacterium]|nr:glycosyltransferase N-terminal domain-containing protein [bacterium]
MQENARTIKTAFWFAIYNSVVLPLIYLGFRIVALFSGKVRQGISGRKRLRAVIAQFNQTRDMSRSLYVVHCASLGEYEMAKPLIEAIRKRSRETYIVLTFFSPSGFEQVRETAPVDLVTYLPFDSVNQVSHFYRTLAPNALILTSYEIWPNLIWLADRYQVEAFLTSARLQNGNAKTYPLVRSLYSTVYGSIGHIYPITQEDYNNLTRYYSLPESTEMQVTGNTRYDRVLERSREARDRRLLPARYRHAPTFIAGSIWPADNKVVLPALKNLLSEYADLQVVLAPHEPSEHHLRDLSDWCENFQVDYELYSNIQQKKEAENHGRVLLVDTIGVLAELYHAGDIAFVGGGFSGSVHNVMEPAVAGCAVLYGPDHQSSNEAEQLVKSGGGFAVTDSEQLWGTLYNLLTDSEALRMAQAQAYGVIERNAGATEATVDRILANQQGDGR